LRFKNFLGLAKSVVHFFEFECFLSLQGRDLPNIIILLLLIIDALILEGELILKFTQIVR